MAEFFQFDYSEKTLRLTWRQPSSTMPCNARLFEDCQTLTKLCKPSKIHINLAVTLIIGTGEKTDAILQEHLSWEILTRVGPNYDGCKNQQSTNRLIRFSKNSAPSLPPLATAPTGNNP